MSCCNPSKRQLKRVTMNKAYRIVGRASLESFWLLTLSPSWRLVQRAPNTSAEHGASWCLGEHCSKSVGHVDQLDQPFWLSKFNIKREDA
ncbi:hypothetical protein MRB53_041098 [Persea americana]|nr:hypothetical protein MRB53_041098 [Persea americana]